MTILTDNAHRWQDRVIVASLATTTGLIIRAMLLRSPETGIRFGNTCDIEKDGCIWTQVNYANKSHRWTKIGTVEDVRDNVRRVADTCKLDDVERTALFEELRKWVRRDYRIQQETVDNVKSS